MRKDTNKNSVIISCLVVAIIAMSVGYAALAEQLTINGTAGTGNASWAIAFQSITKNASLSTDGVNEVSLGESMKEAEVCVRYMYHNDIASKITISANFIPKTLTCILEANLYNGGSCDVETSTLAGKVIIKVPRFMLNGSQELSMSASGVSNTSIEGSARDDLFLYNLN